MSKQNSKIYIGTAGWNYKDWQGIFYPKNLTNNQWLNYYAEHFNAVEINATYYRYFKPDVFTKWYRQTPKDFKFIVKAPRLITHFKKMQDIRKPVKKFLASATSLKDKLGLILLQFPANMPKNIDRIITGIQEFPDPKMLALEFRDNYWYQPEIIAALKNEGICLVNSDSPQISLTSYLTSSIGYCRLHGRSSWYTSNYQQKTLIEIATITNELAQQPTKVVYIIFNNDAQANAVKNAKSLQDIIFKEVNF